MGERVLHPSHDWDDTWIPGSTVCRRCGFFSTGRRATTKCRPTKLRPMERRLDTPEPTP